MKTFTNTLNHCLILGLLFFHLQIFGQSIEWEANFGGAAEDYASQIQQTADEGYIVVGVTGSNNADVSDNYGIVDGWVVKLDKQGVLEWEVNLGGSHFDELRGLDQTADGGYIVVGQSRSDNGVVSNNYGEADVWVVKLNDIGAIVWEKNYGGSAFESARAIQQTEDNGFIIVGGTFSNDLDVSENKGESDAWVLKLDELGTIVWEKTFGGSAFEELYSFDQTEDGGYVLAGLAESADGDLNGNNGGVDYWILKINNLGELEWQKNFGGEDFEAPFSIKQTLDGGYIVVGYTESTGGDISVSIGQADAWVLKLNPSGNLEWEKSLGGPRDDFMGSVQQTNDGRFLLAGGSYSGEGDISGNKGLSDFWLARLDEVGTVVWGKNFGGSKYDEVLSLEETADGGHVLAGYTESDNGDVGGNNGGKDLWIVKFMDLASSITTLEPPANIQLQPNPTNGDFSITLEGKGKKEIKIYNVLGHMIHKTESHESTLHFNDFSKGIYWVNIYNDGVVSTRKLIVE